MERMGGMWATVPLMAGMGLFFALASLGLPGMGNFVGEFLVLLGCYGVNPVIAVPAVLGLVLAAVYSLWMMLQVFQGPRRPSRGRYRICLSGNSPVLGVMAVVLIWSVMYPNPVIRTGRAHGWGIPGTSFDRPGITDPEIRARAGFRVNAARAMTIDQLTALSPLIALSIFSVLVLLADCVLQELPPHGRTHHGRTGHCLCVAVPGSSHVPGDGDFSHRSR